jgi:hypothetical protein
MPMIAAPILGIIISFFICLKCLMPDFFFDKSLFIRIAEITGLYGYCDKYIIWFATFIRLVPKLEYVI